MASAEKLLHEAQYAFQCISFGESFANTRNAAKATSLCKKIIRKYPTSMEASEAHALLRRLGEEAYSSKIAVRHRHISQTEHHQAPSSNSRRGPEQQRTFTVDNEVETLDWAGLVDIVFTMPKALLIVMAFFGIFLFGIFGSFLFLPLIGLVLFTGPFRQVLKQEQRDNLNTLVESINAFIAERRR